MKSVVAVRYNNDNNSCRTTLRLTTKCEPLLSKPRESLLYSMAFMVHVADGFVALSTADTSSQSLNGGEIAGIVIGSLAMISLFAFMVFVILVGPENVFDKCRNITGSGEKAATTASVSASGFDNPLSATEFSEISMT